MPEKQLKPLSFPVFRVDLARFQLWVSSYLFESKASRFAPFAVLLCLREWVFFPSNKVLLFSLIRINFYFWKLKSLLAYLKNSINRGFAKDEGCWIFSQNKYISSHFCSYFLLEFLWKCWACKANFSLVMLEMNSCVEWTNLNFDSWFEMFIC